MLLLLLVLRAILGGFLLLGWAAVAQAWAGRAGLTQALLHVYLQRWQSTSAPQRGRMEPDWLVRRQTLTLWGAWIHLVPLHEAGLESKGHRQKVTHASKSLSERVELGSVVACLYPSSLHKRHVQRRLLLASASTKE